MFDMAWRFRGDWQSAMSLGASAGRVSSRHVMSCRVASCCVRSRHFVLCSLMSVTPVDTSR